MTSTSILDRFLRVLLPAVFWLAVWGAAAFLIGQELLMPSPLAVAKRFAELAGTADFWRCAGASLLRIFCGAAVGVALGTVLAVLTCRFALADLLLSPAIRVILATPVASFIVLVLLWFRTGTVPGVISALIVLPILWESVSTGIRTVDPQLLELAQAYRFGTRKTMRYVYLPHVMPHFSTGVCTAVGLAWKSGVAAEVLCLPKAAIGTQVYYSKIYLETPSLFAWTAVVIVLSMVLALVIRRVLGKGGRK